MKLVTEEAMLQRIRRRLRRENERLVIPRSSHAEQRLGLHITNARSVVLAYHCTVQGLSDELGLLEPDERLQLNLFSASDAIEPA